jgi:hypothetical protein
LSKIEFAFLMLHVSHVGMKKGIAIIALVMSLNAQAGWREALSRLS